MAAAAIPHAALTPTRARHAAGRRTCTNPARARLPCPPNPAEAHVATEATDTLLCRIEGVTPGRIYAQECIIFHDSGQHAYVAATIAAQPFT
jgi:hypothetical protein